MSAMTNLAGLFPPEGISIWNPNLLWQPIPVHTVPLSEDQVSILRKQDFMGPGRIKAGSSGLILPTLFCCSFHFWQFVPLQFYTHRHTQTHTDTHTHTHTRLSVFCLQFPGFLCPHRVLLSPEYPKTSLPRKYPSPNENPYP